jgi:hypothetical protein
VGRALVHGKVEAPSALPRPVKLLFTVVQHEKHTAKVFAVRMLKEHDKVLFAVGNYAV